MVFRPSRYRGALGGTDAGFPDDLMKIVAEREVPRSLFEQKICRKPGKVKNSPDFKGVTNTFSNGMELVI